MRFDTFFHFIIIINFRNERALKLWFIHWACLNPNAFEFVTMIKNWLDHIITLGLKPMVSSDGILTSITEA